MLSWKLWRSFVVAYSTLTDLLARCGANEGLPDMANIEEEKKKCLLPSGTKQASKKKQNPPANLKPQKEGNGGDKRQCL